MRALSFAAVVVFACSLSSQAQTKQFPYEAIVVEDGAYVRSGNKEKYYPTGRLAKGQRVRVHRHDPGGWYMIAPPAGSFSWVPKRYVRVLRDGVGEITGGPGDRTRGDVVAWVGTSFGNEASIFQRRLSVGQQVEVIGEGRIEIDQDRGPEAMLKIKPPRREYRWIRGQAVIPASETGRNSGTGYDFGPPAGERPKQPAAKSGGFLGERPTTRRRSTGSARSSSRKDTRVGNSRTSYDSARIERDRTRLAQLDEYFRTMIDKPTSEWNFAELEAGYLQLKQNAAHPALASQVNLRLPALKRYQKKKMRYDDFVSLTSATNQRDRELTRMASGQNGMSPAAAEILPAPPHVSRPVAPPIQPVAPPSQPIVPQPRTLELPNPSLQLPAVQETPALPVPATPTPTESGLGNGNGGQTGIAPSANLPQTGPIPTPEVVQIGNPDAKPGVTGEPLFDPPEDRTGSHKREPIPPGMTRVPQRRPNFAGAGIIMKSTDLDVPKYVLLAPNGKILAYLDAVGKLDLARHVNFAMALKGDRFHNPKWKADYIKVRSVQRINLQ